MARQLRRATVLAPFVLLAGFLALSCFDNTSGPRVFEGRFSIVPRFASSAAEIVTLDRFRVLLRRTSDNSVALDTTIAIVPGTDSVDLSLSVPMFTSSESFLLTLSLITPAGDTAFQAADTVTASTSGGAPPAIPVTVVYTGVGSHAKAVQILTVSPSVLFGDTVTLVAEALDSNGVAIPLTPVAWASLDTLRAKVPNAGVGKVVGVSQRGLARITATLLNGPMDTVAVLVQPRPARMAVEGGNNQSAQVATALAQPVRFRVKAADSLGVANIVVKFGVVAGGGTLNLDSAVTNDSGRVDVQWTLGPTAGAQAIRARIKAAIADSVVTAFAKASAGPPDSLAINDGDGQSAVAGLAVATAPSVVVRDSLNNPVPGAGVTFQVTGGGGSITAATPVTDSLGVARVGSWTLGTLAGANALRAFVVRGPGDTLNVSFNATAVAAAAASLTLSGIPSPINAGLPASVAVTAKDAYGNVARGYRGTVHFTSTDAKALLPADYAFVAGDSGVHTFSLTLAVAGSQSVTATDAGAPSITGSQTVTVVPGLASALTSVVTVSSGTVVSGGVVTLRLQAKDAAGNTITTGGESVLFRATGGTSTGSISATADSGNGVYTATFTGVLAGTATAIGATINTVAVTTSLPTVTVTPGPISAATSVITVSSPSVASAANDTLRLRAKDAAGNNLTTGGATVVFSASGGTSAGTISATTDSSNGVYVAIFTGVTAGTATTIGATVNGTPVATTLPTITVTGGAPASLIFTSEPVNTTVNSAIAPFQVTAKDAANNVATGFNGPVTVALQNNPAGGSLGGTATVSAVNGVATFSNVSITTVGSRYALQASATGVTPVTSQQFLITPVGMTHLWTGATSTDWTVGTNWQGGTAPLSITDNVFVPTSAATQPTISAPALTVGAVVVETGATVTIASGDTLSVFGDLLAGFTSVAGPGAVRLVGSGKLAGSLPSVLLAGRYTASDSVKVSGDLIVRGPGDTLNLGGRRVKVTGAFGTDSSAILVMASAADTLDVAGTITFAGGNDTLLTAGVILARGDFIQTGSMRQNGNCFVADAPESFKARGTHQVEFVGTVLQSISFETSRGTLAPPVTTLLVEVLCPPAYTGGSQFQNLKVANAAGVSLGSGVIVPGNLTATSGDITFGSQYASVGGNVTTAGALSGSPGSLLEVGGTLSVGGTFGVENTTFFANNPVIPLTLPYVNLTIAGTGNTTLGSGSPFALSGGTGNLAIGNTAHVSLGGQTTVGAILVAGDAQVILNHQTLVVNSTFQSKANGQLVMNQPEDLLQLKSDAYFQSHQPLGTLTNGTVEVYGQFYGTDCGCTDNFVASGNHKVRLLGSASAQVVGLDDPTTSHFQTLEIVNSNGMAIRYHAAVAGDLISNPGGPIGIAQFSSPGNLYVGGNLANLPALSVNELSVGGTLSVSIAFAVADTAYFTGTNQTIPTGGIYNYNNLAVTGSAALSGPVSVNDLAVKSGGQLDIGTNTVTVVGNVDAGNTIVGTGTIQMTGVGKTLSGTLPNLVVSGAVSLAGSTAVTDSAKVSAATLTVNGQRLTVGGDLILDGPSNAPGGLSFNSGGAGGQVQISGTLVADRQYYSLVMTHPTDSLITLGGFVAVNGPAQAPYDTLKAGVMYIGKVFNAYQFFPDSLGTHKVVLAGNDAAVAPYFYLNDGWFRDLEVTTLASATDATWQLQSTFSTDTLVYGNLVVSRGGILDVGGFTVLGNVTTTDNGRVKSTSFSPTLRVHGDATFGGGGTDGLLTSGMLVLYGNFSQTTSAKAFAAGSGFTTSFVGTAPQSISFANPDTSASHFGDLRIAQPGASAPGVSLLSPIVTVGSLRVPGDSLAYPQATGPQTITGNAKPLTVGGLNISGLTLNDALLTWDGTGPFSGAYTRAYNMTFSNYLDSDIQFYIHHPGLSASAQVVTSNLTFLSLADPAKGGYYMKAEDSDGALIDTLIVYTYFFNSNLPNEPWGGFPNACDAASAKFLGVPPAQILYGCS